MTARELKIKTLSLIEEFYPNSPVLADDEDIQHKINGVINQVIMDLSKFHKIPAKYEYNITNESAKTLDMSKIPNMWQLNIIKGLDYNIYGDKEIEFNVDEFPTKASIYYYKFPTLMDLEFKATNTKTKDEVIKEYDEDFEFDIAEDLLEIAPYGIASDLLKLDMISNYGQYFASKYSELKNLIDSRATTGTIIISGGYEI